MDTHEAQDTLGARLVWARETAGLSQSQAAKLLNISKEDLIDAETDALWPGMFASAETWCRVYDVDMHWLKTGIEREVDLGSVPAYVSAEDRESLRRLLARRWQDS